MNIWKPVKIKWWQMGLFKISLICIGIIIGSTIPDVFILYRSYLFTVAIILGCYVGYVWLKGSESRN